MPDDLPGYDAWKTRLPPEPYSDDPDCTCTTERRDRWCPVHGKDPDQAYEERRERQWDRQWDREQWSDC
jgi:hypothetical protein